MCRATAPLPNPPAQQGVPAPNRCSRAAGRPRRPAPGSRAVEPARPAAGVARAASSPGRVVARRDAVQQPRRMHGELRLKRVDAHPVVIDRDPDDLQPVVGEDAQRQEVGRLLDEHDITGLSQRAAAQVDGLRVSVADEQPPAVDRHAVMPGEEVGKRGSQVPIAPFDAVRERVRLPGRGRHGHRASHQLDRQDRVLWLAHTKVDDTGPVLHLGRLAQQVLVRHRCRNRQPVDSTTNATMRAPTAISM